MAGEVSRGGHSRGRRYDRLRACFDLIRLPNLFTAQADVLAGFLYAGGATGDWPTVVLLAGASSCLYAGGVALNDVCDVAQDARERPGRPIPSGRVTRRSAGYLAVGLLLLGLALAVIASPRAGVIGGALVAAIVLYDVVLKSTIVAPAMMGACRVLNLLLGMSTAEDIPYLQAVVPLAVVGLYIASVTYFARAEAGLNAPKRLVIGTLGAGTAVAGLTFLYAVVPNGHTGYLVLAALLGVGVVVSGLRAAAYPEPVRVQRTVKGFVIALIAVDTCIAWSTRGLWVSMAVAVMIVPCLIAGRRFRVT